jgi:hypothetical protein
MVAGYSIDGTLIVLVGLVELRLVILYVTCGVDDVAADDHKVRVLPIRQEWLHDLILGIVSLPRIPNYEERDLFEIRVIFEDQVRRKLSIPPLYL